MQLKFPTHCFLFAIRVIPRCTWRQYSACLCKTLYLKHCTNTNCTGNFTLADPPKKREFPFLISTSSMDISLMLSLDSHTVMLASANGEDTLQLAISICSTSSQRWIKVYSGIQLVSRITRCSIYVYIHICVYVCIVRVLRRLRAIIIFITPMLCTNNNICVTLGPAVPPSAQTLTIGTKLVTHALKCYLYIRVGNNIAQTREYIISTQFVVLPLLYGAMQYIYICIYIHIYIYTYMNILPWDRI